MRRFPPKLLWPDSVRSMVCMHSLVSTLHLDLGRPHAHFPNGCMYLYVCIFFLVPCPTNPRSLICLISASSAQMRWVSLPSCHLRDERKCFVLFICFPVLGHHCPLSPVSPYVEVVASYSLSSFIFLYIEYNSSLTYSSLT